MGNPPTPPKASLGTPQGSPSGRQEASDGAPLMTPQGVEGEVVITPPQPPSSRSSVLYALGQLSAQVASLKEIPAQVSAVMLPRITHLEAGYLTLDQRLSALERTKYLVWGGGVVVLGGVGLIIKLSPSLFR